MPPDEYVKALDKALADLEQRVQQRDLLNAEIAGLKETVRVLSNRVPLPADRQQRVAQLIAMLDYATPNLTDSIRSLLTRVYPKELTAIEVRNSLEETGFGFEDFSNPLAACHTTLKRLLADEEVEPGGEKNGKPTYTRKLKIPTLGSGFNRLAVLAGVNVPVGDWLTPSLETMEKELQKPALRHPAKRKRLVEEVRESEKNSSLPTPRPKFYGK